MIFISFIFYKSYFKTKKDIAKIEIQTNASEVLAETDKKKFTKKESNIIKNLRYNVNLLQSGEYEIQAKLSEISYKGNVEIVSMQKVVAKFTDKNKKKIIITSDKAIFNNLTYDTNFTDNIKIQYLNNIIISDHLDFNFIENNIKIYGNVIYKGVNGTIETDNIKINLITKNIEIFMNKPNNKINITSN